MRRSYLIFAIYFYLFVLYVLLAYNDYSDYYGNTSEDNYYCYNFVDASVFVVVVVVDSNEAISANENSKGDYVLTDSLHVVWWLDIFDYVYTLHSGYLCSSKLCCKLTRKSVILYYTICVVVWDARYWRTMLCSSIRAKRSKSNMLCALILLIQVAI